MWGGRSPPPHSVEIGGDDPPRPPRSLRPCMLYLSEGLPSYRSTLLLVYAHNHVIIYEQLQCERIYKGCSVKMYL